jgi:CheY-like chemotaxis protein
MLLRDKRVFVVEDNTHNRVVFQMALLRHGAFITHARHGLDTIRQLKNAGIVDVVLMDLMLDEGISGFDLAAQIRALPEYARVPVVAVSSMDPSVAIPRAQAEGFAGFVAKPIETHLFAQQIATILRGEAIWYSGERSITS